MTDQPPPTPAEPPPVAWEPPSTTPARIEVGSVVGRTLDTYGADPALFLALSLPIAAPAAILAVIPPDPSAAGAILVLVLAWVAVSLVASLAVVLATDQLWRGREPDVGAALRLAVGRTPALVGAYLLALVAIVGVVAAVVIGALVIPPAIAALAAVVLTVLLLYGAVRFAPIGQVIVLERVGGLASFRRSWELTRGSGWRILGVVLLLGLVTMPASFGGQLVTLLSRERLLVGLAAGLAALVTTPVILIGLTVAWADLAERGYQAGGRVPTGRGRRIALALLLGLGALLSVIGISQAAGRNLADFLPLPGRIVAGSQRNQFDPCLPLDIRTTFSSTDEVWVGGYFREPVMPGTQATVEVYLDGELRSTVPIVADRQPVSCYHEPGSLEGSTPGTYGIVVRYDRRSIAEGSFVIEP